MDLQPNPCPERLFYFRHRFRGGQRALRGLLVAAPWMDVLLLVLIFFITQSSFVVQPGVSIELPPAPLTGGVRYGDLIVAVPQEGVFFFRDERMTASGLAVALQRAVAASPEASLLVQADARISHRGLMEVYTMARAAGVREVLLATRPPSTL